MTARLSNDHGVTMTYNGNAVVVNAGLLVQFFLQLSMLGMRSVRHSGQYEALQKR